MANRVTLVVLFEDEMHATFINAFLKRMKIPSIGRTRLVRKGNKSNVFEAFPEEVRSLRSVHVQSRLIVVVDADELSDIQIQDKFRKKLRDADLDDEVKNDPILIIRPRWEMENWALLLLGEPIGETKTIDARKQVGDRGRTAARLLADACSSRQLPVSASPSLRLACEEWQAHRKRWSY